MPDVLKCPVCRAPYRPAPVAEGEARSALPSRRESLLCKRCGVDLAPLIRLYDQALWHHRRAIHLFQQGNYSAARTSNDQAIHLHRRQPDFQALAGCLWAVEGEFGRAIATWKHTLTLDPQNAIAQTALQTLTELSVREDGGDRPISDTLAE